PDPGRLRVQPHQVAEDGPQVGCRSTAREPCATVEDVRRGRCRAHEPTSGLAPLELDHINHRRRHVRRQPGQPPTGVHAIRSLDLPASWYDGWTDLGCDSCAGGSAGYVTTIVPFMNGCIEQW